MSDKVDRSLMMLLLLQRLPGPWAAGIKTSKQRVVGCDVPPLQAHMGIKHANPLSLASFSASVTLRSLKCHHAENSLTSFTLEPFRPKCSDVTTP